MTFASARLCVGFLLAMPICSGCEPGCPGAPTSQPSMMASDPALEPQRAKVLERDMVVLRRAHTEGLLTANEYDQAVFRVVSEIDNASHTLSMGIDPNLTAPQLYTELAYLARLKQQGTLTQDQYEQARRSMVISFVPPDAPTTRPE